MNYDEQEKISNIKIQKVIEQMGVCAGCGELFKPNDIIELGHILPQRKWIISLYGKEIIHHPMNMKATHSGRCNSAVQISPNKTKAVNDHIQAIRDKIDEEAV